MRLIISLGLLHSLLVIFICFFVEQHLFLVVLLIIISLLVTNLLFKKHYARQDLILLTLEHGLQRLRDNDFSVSLSQQKEERYNAIINSFNQTSNKLRQERQHLYQREMMLDKVLNASPMVTILVDHRDTITFTNNSAQHAFELKGSIVGLKWSKLLASLAPEFQHALKHKGESIFSLTDQQGTPQAWHVACSTVVINQAKHQLFLLKTITQELSKQEIATWKKVISAISHELNNSIAPISSMCHSGEMLANTIDEPRLNRVFKTISGRVNHLNDFIKGYATLTKVKIPNKQLIDWEGLIEQVRVLYPFTLSTSLPKTTFYADIAQLEQVFINLLKNAHEADETGKIDLGFIISNNAIEITINDNGTGMSAEVIQNALLPFYSTKHSGTGIGLALCREIIEAHEGRLMFKNREAGGLSVLIILPL